MTFFDTTSNAVLAAALIAFAGLGSVLILLNSSERNHGIAAEVAATGLYLTLVVFRAPTLLSFYRLWAETGAMYFGHAYRHGPIAGLLNTSSNYYDLSANVASAVAVFAGLQWWPVVDTGLGLACAAALPFILLGLRFSQTQRIAILLAVATAFFCVTGSETFGTVLHNKGWGAVYAAILLASIASKPGTNTFQKVLLFIVPLTGTVTVFVLATWAIAAAILRLKPLLTPLAWAIPGIAVQIICALLPPEQTGLAVRPLSPIALLYVPDLFIVKVVGAAFFPSLFFRDTAPGVLETVLTIGLSFVIVLAAFYAAYRRHYLALLILMAMGVYYGSAVLAVGGIDLLLEAGSSYRYYFPPVAILLVALALSVSMSGMAARAAFVLVCIIIVGANHSYNVTVSRLFWEPQEGWDWSPQARAHLSSPDELLKNYPYPASGIRLPGCGEHYC